MTKVDTLDAGDPRASWTDGAATGTRASEAPLLDPDRLLGQLDVLHHRAVSWQRCERLELYHRASVGLRLATEGRPQSVETHAGHDEGLAVRLQPRREKGVAFASVSGCGEATLRWALEQATRGRVAVLRNNRGWPSEGASSLVDRDQPARLPAPGEMLAWMDQARELAVDQKPRGGSVELLRSWVEVGLTVESWATESGLRASRRRVRAWGTLQVRPKGANVTVLTVASRSWEGLSADGWRNLLDQRMIPRRSRREKENRRATVVFTPETSATLTAALVRAVHTEATEPGDPVGPGWSLRDLPQDPEALFGGLFDDAGFYTSPTRLAEEGRISGRIAGEGHFRRPSFRDVPVPMHSHLVVDTVERPLPEHGLLVSDLRIHAFRPGRWILEVRGGPLPEGVSGPTVLEGYIQVAPRELLWHCAACLAPQNVSYRGVRTGSLLFEDLPIS